MGTLAYTSLPDTLARELLAAGAGVGLGVKVPEAWEGHLWLGTGTPKPETVHQLMSCLATGGDLPSAETLRANAELEASALKALDLTAPARLAVVLHADDPVTLESSKGALQAAVNLISAWAYRKRAQFHVGPSKTVVMVVGPAAAHEADYQEKPICMPARDGTAPTPLSLACQHRWLGMLWANNLVFTAAARSRIGQAASQYSILVGLVESRAIPLPLAVELFEAKVDARVQPGRWLFALTDGVCALLDEQYDSWARGLLGAKPWNNAAVAASELGWSLSGTARAVKAVAFRRATIWQLQDDDIYKLAFLHARGAGTWSWKSLAMLQRWGVLDWPAWRASGSTSYVAYKVAVKAALVARSSLPRAPVLAQHRAPYTCFQLCTSSALSDMLKGGLPWDVLVAARGWCRMRAGLTCLAARDGRPSSAIFQECIFCGMGVEDGRRRFAIIHCLGQCPHWNSWRSAFCNELSSQGILGIRDTALSALRTLPFQPGFDVSVRWLDTVDTEASEWWRRSEHTR